VTDRSEHDNETTSFIKTLGISLLAKEFATSRDGLRSFELVVTAFHWMAEENHVRTQDKRIPDQGSNP